MVLFYLDEIEDNISDVCAVRKADESAWVWENLSDPLACIHIILGELNLTDLKERPFYY